MHSLGGKIALKSAGLMLPLLLLGVYFANRATTWGFVGLVLVVALIPLAYGHSVGRYEARECDELQWPCRQRFGLKDWVMLLLVVITPVLAAFPFAQEFAFTTQSSGQQLSLIGILSLLTLSLLWAPIIEEVLSRGILFRWLLGRFRVELAVSIQGLAFMGTHYIGTTSRDAIAYYPMTFVAGMVLCLLFIRSGSLLVPMVAHVLWNLISAVAIALGGQQDPFEVSFWNFTQIYVLAGFMCWAALGYYLIAGGALRDQRMAGIPKG